VKSAARLVAAILSAALVASGCSGSPSDTADSPSLLEDIKNRGVVRIGTRVDNPPHSSFDESGKWQGFDNDIAQAIGKQWNVRIEMIKVDELTRISFLQNGKIDLAVASISKTRKRAEQVDFSQTYFYSVQTFVVRKGTAAKYEDLVGKRVGASRGSSSIANWRGWLKRHGVTEEPQIEEFGDKRAALDAVKQGAIAGWTEDFEVLASYVRKEPSLSVLNVAGGTGVKLDGIAMRKNEPELVQAVNLALQEIAASGEYDKIYDRWFGPASTAPVPRQGSIEVWPHG
jgi:polar amino acid transport system substrate-binding protein